MASGVACGRLPILAIAVLAAIWLAATSAFGQATVWAEPVTSPGVTTIGNIASNKSVNVRSGPAILFPVTGQLPFGTRVSKGGCIGGGSARWCQIETVDARVSGYVSARFLV